MTKNKNSQSLKELLKKIRKEIQELRKVFVTQDELSQMQDEEREFYEKMDLLKNSTLSNTERYKQKGWKELIYDEDSEDDE